MKIIKIFLASSSELEEERREFEVFIRRKNDEVNFRDLYFKLNIWEDFVDAMSKTRLQDEYNKAIIECDIFIMLFFTKVGKYTEEEFSIALKHFQITNKPLIYAYHKNIPFIPTEEFNTVIEFKKRLLNLGHFCSTYDSNKDLQFQITNQLSKLYPPQGVISNKYPQELTLIPKICETDYVGRKTEIKKLHSILFDEKKMIIVSGFGGIGKTMLAQAYVCKYYEDYAHIAWVTQGDENASKAFLSNKELIENLGFDYTEISQIEETERLKEILKRHREIEQKPNLLVIDNSDTTICHIKQYLPGKPNWHVLITSRENIAMEENCEPYPLDLLSKELAFQLFKKHCSITKYSDENIYSILKTIEYHTLTIEILAKTAQLRRTEFDKLKIALETDLISLVPKNGEIIARVTSYLNSLFNFTKLDDNEIWIMKQFCFFPPDYHTTRIIEDLLQVGKLPWTEDFYMTINSLCNKGWLLYNKETDSFNMHRIINEVAINKITPSYEDVKPLFQNLSDLLGVEDGVDDYLEHIKWIPFGKAILDRIETILRFNQFASKPEIYTIQRNLGWLYDELGENEDAKIILHKALQSAKTNIENENIFINDCQSRLAFILHNMNEYEEAKRLMEQVIETDIRILDKEDILLALHRCRMARIYSSLDEYEKANNLMDIVTKVIKKAGDNSLKTAHVQKNLAFLYLTNNRYDDAKQLFEKALLIYSNKLINNHPYIADIYYGLGMMYSCIGEREKAQELLEKTICIYNKHFRENTTKVAKVYYQLGIAYIGADMNESEKAYVYFKKALNTFRENHNQNHLIEKIQYFLGIIYYAKNEHEKAQDILENALLGCTKKSGESSDDVANIQFILDKVYLELNKTGKPVAI